MHSTLAVNETPLYQRLEAVTVEVLDLRTEELRPDTHFTDDLGADSLDLVELVEALEQEFHVSISDEELADVMTVGEAYELLAAKLAA